MSVEKATRDLARLQIEIASLRSKLTDSEGRAIKIKHYIEMASKYGTGDESGVQEPGIDRSDRERAKAIDIIENILQIEKKPLKTIDLLKFLMERGINIGGHNPITNLSSSLSRDPRFKASRTEGWGLVIWQHSDANHTSGSDAEAGDNKNTFSESDGLIDIDDDEEVPF